MLLLAGCTPTPPPSAVPSSAAPSEARTTVPACDSPEVTERSDPTAALRCEFRDPRFPRLRFDYSDPGGGHGERDEVVVIRDGDRIVQTIRERIESSYPEVPFVPRWANDGSGQLVVVTNSGGSGGIAMAVWRALGPEGPFVRGGELFGFPYRTATTDEGFTALYAHASAISGGYTIFRLVGDRVVELLNLPVAVASVDHTTLDENAPTIVNRNTRCQVVAPSPAQAEALRAAGVTADGAAERFCRQSWVGRTYAG